ncbi:winged helix-turn-helix transcriptional regulator [Paucidesulfovibrio gracilis]|nr:winged helix-turn-helix transcriptional regulator [Paucidesulfovibrio gracilis]
MDILRTYGKYLKPSKQARVLAILDALNDDSGLSQYELGCRLHLSSAMVNQYLRSMQQEDLVRFKPRDGKSYHYELTAEGQACRESMFAEYSSETVQLYSRIKRYVKSRVLGLERSGRTRVVLFGAAETCEVVLSALMDGGLTVLALLDNDEEKHGRVFHGHVIGHPALLEQIDCDAVVITSFGKQQEIFEQLSSFSERKGIPIVRM